MRKIIFSLLLASVAMTPAVARPDRQDEPSQQNDRADRQAHQEAREQVRAQRSDDNDRPARPRFDGNRGERRQFDGARPSFDGQASAVARANPADVEQIRAVREAHGGDGVARWNRDNVQRSGEMSHWTRQPDQRSGETERWTRDRSNGWTQAGGEVNQRQAWQQRQPTTTEHRRWSETWNRDWRSDRRYDWRRYRDQHRSIFRIGIYYDPFGYSYRRYDVGYRLSPAYYGQRYWFDPGMYGLPYPPPGTQWVRYWDDALLVDIYSGQVVDVIPNFFW